MIPVDARANWHECNWAISEWEFLAGVTGHSAPVNIGRRQRSSAPATLAPKTGRPTYAPVRIDLKAIASSLRHILNIHTGLYLPFPKGGLAHGKPERKLEVARSLRCQLWGHLVQRSSLMRPISTEGFENSKVAPSGAAPMLQWLKISDLVIDPAYQRPIVGKGRRNVDRIARSFSWSCFAPVVVSPIEGGRFAIIDGQHRTTAAALVGLESVPCQVVIAARDEQAAAFKAINGLTTPISRMALHAAALVAGESGAMRIADACARAEVELLRYPVPADKQSPGQTMAVGAIASCLRRYGEETLITALQCVTQTSNNRPGALSAHAIKALCATLHSVPHWRDSGLALLEAFDAIDLIEIQNLSAVDAASKRVGRVQAMADRIRNELDRRIPQRKAAREVFGSHDLRTGREFSNAIRHE